jgi:hypothetical protein
VIEATIAFGSGMLCTKFITVPVHHGPIFDIVCLLVFVIVGSVVGMIGTEIVF